MREVLPELLTALDEDGAVALATVVRTWGSSPRPAGASMLRCLDGRAVGSISGGCVEGSTYDVADEVLRTGRSELCRFDVTDDDAMAIGLTCGGTIEVLVERIEVVERGTWQALAELLDHGGSATLATRMDLDDTPSCARHLVVGAAGVVGPGWTPAELQVVEAAAAEGGGVSRLADDEVFVTVIESAPRMLIYGAVDFAAALDQQARLLGYRTTVCDARSVFATVERFPEAHEVVVDWPHRHLESEISAGRTDHRTAVCVLTHDQKFDVPLLVLALSRDDLGYVGAMGSARTHHRRVSALSDAGVAGDQLDRLRSPIGLHLGGRTPAETALSIVAEITADRYQGSMGALRGADVPIHGLAR